MDLPIYNPVIPFSNEIPGGFGPGRMIQIEGKIPEYSRRFAISLCTSVDENADIGLQVKAKVDKKVMERNARSGTGGWGWKEIKGSPLPLERGQDFLLTILCGLRVYKISLNGSHFTDFNHRVPVTRVTQLKIEGDVSISRVTFGHCDTAVDSPEQEMNSQDGKERQKIDENFELVHESTLDFFHNTRGKEATDLKNDKSWRRRGRRTKIIHVTSKDDEKIDGE